MLSNADPIIFPWLVPAFLFLFLPLTLITVALLRALTRRFFSAAKVNYNEKRKHQRFVSHEAIVAKVIVGDKTCAAFVSDISQTGICLKHLPEVFSHKIDIIPVVVKRYGVDYNLLVKAKWNELTGSGEMIGAEIDTACPEWGQLLLQTAKN